MFIVELRWRGLLFFKKSVFKDRSLLDNLMFRDMTAHEIKNSNYFIYAYVNYFGEEEEKDIVYNFFKYYLSLVPQSVLERLKFDYDEIKVGKNVYHLNIPESYIDDWKRDGFVLDKDNMVLYLDSSYLMSFNPVCLNLFISYIYEKSNIKLSKYFQKAYEKERDLIWEIKHWNDTDDKRGFFCQLMGIELTNSWDTVNFDKDSLYSYLFIDRLKLVLDESIKMPIFNNDIDIVLELR